jgi:hypothetical protein
MSSQQDNACALDGRAIFLVKELVLKNMKKAIAFAKMYCKKGAAFPKLPSDKTEEDFDQFILNKMYLAESKKESPLICLLWQWRIPLLVH